MSILFSETVVKNSTVNIQAAIRDKGCNKCLQILYADFARINYKANDGLDRSYSMHLLGFQAVINYISKLAAEQPATIRPGLVTGAWFKGFSRAMDVLKRQ